MRVSAPRPDLFILKKFLITIASLANDSVSSGRVRVAAILLLTLGGCYSRLVHRRLGVPEDYI